MFNRSDVKIILKLLEKERDCVFLETAKLDNQNYLSYLFLRPKEIVSTNRIDEVDDCFNRLNLALKKGYYTAGFLSYEAGCAFEERLRHQQVFDFPLLWFGIYKRPLIYDHRRASFTASVPAQKYLLKDIRPNISQQTYTRAIAKIKGFIARGFTYQVNYTFKLKFSISGSPQGLYLNLRDNQPVSYSAFIKTGEHTILSFSPELFFRKKASSILTRPMKGTIKRGRNLNEDALKIQDLGNCQKNRSENLMIVDLLRNDLGRISRTGSVRVNRLFNVEKYNTLFQMTSDIKSRLKGEKVYFDLFRHIFPSGSVTGAPKIKTMQIIRPLEKEPRRIYTGSIGFFSPENLGVFNVAIRTVLINRKTGASEMGVGSGIVYDSIAESEFAECCLKADFLTKRHKDTQLIETMLWRPGKGYLLLDAHLKRLKASAKYFDFVYNKKDTLDALLRLERRFGKRDYRVRLLLNREGRISLKPSLFKRPQGKRLRICLSAKHTHSQDPFLYHKTTNRLFYDREYKKCKQQGFFDVIFANEKGEITEGAVSNIFIRKNGRFLTPPVSCGLLDGVYRRHILGSKDYRIKEKTLFKEDLYNAQEIYLSNSVRGFNKVYLEAKDY